MLDWHSCQICYPPEIKILLLLHCAGCQLVCPRFVVSRFFTLPLRAKGAVRSLIVPLPGDISLFLSPFALNSSIKSPYRLSQFPPVPQAVHVSLHAIFKPRLEKTCDRKFRTRHKLACSATMAS